MLYVVIPVHNSLGHVQECLPALEAQSYRSFRIVMVDDGSSDGTEAHLAARHPEVMVVQGTGDWWWAKSMNEGIRRILPQCRERDFILSLNIDLRVGPDYFSELVRYAQAHTPCVVGSVSRDGREGGRIEFAGVTWNRWTARYKGITSPVAVSKPPYYTSDLLPGRGTLFPAEVFKQCGLYNSACFPQYVGDDEMSLRARRRGYKLLVCPTAVVMSDTENTGENFKLHDRPALRPFLRSLFIVKSPFYLKARFHFARKHAPLWPLYFALDLARIFAAFGLSVSRYHLNNLQSGSHTAGNKGT